MISMLKEVLAALFIIVALIIFAKLSSWKFHGRRVISLKATILISLLFPLLILLFFLAGFLIFIIIGFVLLIIFLMFVLGRKKVHYFRF